MIDQTTILEKLEEAQAARDARRRFIRMCGGAAAMAGGLTMLSACGDDDDDDVAVTPTPTPTPPPAGNADLDVLNFALQLEYLEGNYYNLGAFGTAVPANLTTGVGATGAVVGGRRVTFTDPVVAEFMREIAVDELAHITFLRQALGASASAQPAINIAGDATGAFTLAARAAGVIGANETFDPYANDENFTLGAFLLTDVGVTAYRGSARLITNKTFLEAAAGILAVECYHDAAIRTTLYSKGLTRADLRTNTVRISDARDALDGAANNDEGVVDASGNANLVPADVNGLVFGRTAPQVLNVVYNNRAAVSQGGFFPAGVNGAIRTSANNA
jgi:hypothetical protein